MNKLKNAQEALRKALERKRKDIREVKRAGLDSKAESPTILGLPSTLTSQEMTALAQGMQQDFPHSPEMLLQRSFLVPVSSSEL